MDVKIIPRSKTVSGQLNMWYNNWGMKVQWGRGKVSETAPKDGYVPPEQAEQVKWTHKRIWVHFMNAQIKD
jgi:hypothetical protein